MKISIPAILGGLVISFILDIIFSYVLLFAYGWSLASSVGPSARYMSQTQLYTMLLESDFFIIGSIVAAALSGLIASYCVIRLAGFLNPLLHSFVFAILSVVIGLLIQRLIPQPAPIPAWILAMSYAFSVVGSLVAGVFAQMSLETSREVGNYA